MNINFQNYIDQLTTQQEQSVKESAQSKGRWSYDPKSEEAEALKKVLSDLNKDLEALQPDRLKSTDAQCLCDIKAILQGQAQGKSEKDKGGVEKLSSVVEVEIDKLSQKILKEIDVLLRPSLGEEGDKKEIKKLQQAKNFLSSGEVIQSLKTALNKKDLNLIISLLQQNKVLFQPNRTERSELIQMLATAIDFVNSQMVIEIADKIEDKQLFKDYVLFFNKKINRGPDDWLFFDIFDDQSFEKVKMLIEKGYPLTSQTISQVLYSHNYTCIRYVLDHMTDEEIERNAAHILKELMKIEESKIGELIIKRAPGIFAKVDTFSLLSDAVSKRHAWFVDWSLAHSGKLTSDELKKLMPLALDSSNLQIIKSLCQHTDQEGVQNPILYPQILGLEKITDEKELLQRVTAFAITSPLPDVHKLAALYPNQIGKVLPEALEIASLLVRFPNKEYAQEVNPKFEKTAAYLEDSVFYAHENLDFMTSMQPELDGKNKTRNQLLDAIMDNRFRRMKNPNNKYKTKQIDSPMPVYTPLRYKTSANIHLMTFSTSKSFTRYGWSIRHFADMSFDWDDQKWKIPPGYSMELKEKLNYRKGIDRQILYSYPDPLNPETKYPLTSLSGLLTQWDHTGAKTIKELQPHLETLQREILDFPPLNPSNQKEFFDKVARCYWLMATSCETLRGTPHNVMIWLNLVYTHHHLPPPIPKMDHFFLDNTMLMIPVEKAIEDWHSFFEPTLDQSLADESNGHELLKNLLEQNGLLLRFCSQEIRNDKPLALNAIIQNKEAMQYLPKELQDEFQRFV
jgi:hypothetical protein